MDELTHRTPLAELERSAVVPAPSLKLDDGIDWAFHLRYRQACIHEKGMPPYLLLPEVNKLLDAMTGDHYNKAKFIWYTGARISEAMATKKQSLTFYTERGEQRALVTLKTAKQRGRQKSGQIDRTRDIPIRDHDYALELKRLADNLPGRARETPLLAQTSRQAFDDYLKTTCDKIGIMRIGAHVLRHSFACNLILHRRDVFFVQKMLGHSRIESTLIYLRLLDLDMAFLLDGVKFR
jgi:integrase